jgi:hypothetical protein
LGLDDDGIHAEAPAAGIAPEGNSPGRKGLGKQPEGIRVSRKGQVLTGVGKGAQPGRFRDDSRIVSHIHNHRLIDLKAQEGRRGGRFIIVGSLNIRGALHAGGNGGEGIGAVDIDKVPGLEA